MTPVERADKLYWKLKESVFPIYDEQVAEIQKAIEDAVAEEREACAVVAELYDDAEHIATAIRGRSTAIHFVAYNGPGFSLNST